jgi:predicted nucleic acid-binding protein
VNGWLLDTNVVSELRKKRPDRRVKAWSDVQVADSLFLSSVTLAEIRYGIEKQPDPKFRKELATWLDHRLRPWFAGRILPVDEEVILEWRRMVARGREQSITFSQPDLFIAATAHVHSLTVCTRNEGDFLRAAVPVVNPWSE